MIAIADCLVEAHDLKLVVVAGALCALASGTAFALLRCALFTRERSRGLVWIALAALVAGSGVWATHFVAMLAFRPNLPTAFEFGATFASLVVSVSVSGCAFGVTVLTRSLAGRVCAGILLGLSTATMHFTGTGGLHVTGAVTWNPSLIAASVLASVLLALPALLLGTASPSRARWAGGTALFTLSILALHFTGMSALVLVPDPAQALPAGLLSGTALAYGVAAVTLVIVGCAFATVTTDRHSRRDTEEKLRFMARHDTLTSLPNRVLFEEIVRREIGSNEAAHRSVAILCVDLDGFKEVNDIFGHATGDGLLVEVSRRLTDLLGERCVAARLGGDEFAVLATGLGRFKTPAVAAQSVLDALCRPFDIEATRIDIGCSIGIARYPEDGASYPELLMHADTALFRAKSDGKGVFRFFEASMDAVLRERREIAGDLRAAIGTDLLRLDYQPQHDVESGAVTGFEALLRWDHPVRGPISPSVFIPIAEETGLILPIGEWVLRTACREAAGWEVPLGIAVNLSVAQFRQTGLGDMVMAVLRETGLAPGRLELEVTESLFLDHAARALGVLQQVRLLGVRIAMDDFGTGYSSLSTLQAFPFDKLKVDRSFVAQVGETARGTAIVKAILGLGESLGMNVVAEGVETTEQLAFLREHGCGEAQGYLCGRPRPIESYRHLVVRPRPEAARPDSPRPMDDGPTTVVQRRFG